MDVVERSVLGRSWRLRTFDEAAAIAISQQHGITEVLGRVLAGRGVGPKQAGEFLAPRLRDWLPDSGWQLDYRPCFEHYPLDAGSDAPTQRFECEICIPVAAA